MAHSENNGKFMNVLILQAAVKHCPHCHFLETVPQGPKLKLLHVPSFLHKVKKLSIA